MENIFHLNNFNWKQILNPYLNGIESLDSSKYSVSNSEVEWSQYLSNDAAKKQ